MSNCYHCKSEDFNVITKHRNTALVQCMNCNSPRFITLSKDCCESMDLIDIRFEQTNNVVVQRKVCKNCKILYKGAIKKSINFNNLPLLHQQKFRVLSKIDEEKRDELNNQFNLLTEKNKLRLEIERDEYYNSITWKNIRVKILKRDNYICQGCLSNKATEVHHLSYQNFKDELYFQLISLCRTCHSKIHNK